jgi:hypothetical protein
MRYATWNLLFTDNVTEGATTPSGLKGAFHCNLEQTKVAGYLPDDLDITTLASWEVVEITEVQFLELLLSLNPNGELREGMAWTPPYDFENGNN